MAAGRLPPNIALLHVLMNASSRGEAQKMIEAAQASADPLAAQRIGAALALLHAHPDAFDLVRGVLASVSHDTAAPSPEQALTELAQAFDRAAARSPGGSSALYALGDEGLLARATGEVVEALARWGLLASDRRLLEVGCGSGRFVEALAPEMRTVLGAEISAVMAKSAQDRTRRLTNACVIQCSGRDLSFVADASLDLVLYADSFPYLVQAGGELATRHVGESARVLKPGGRLVIFNLSYRGDTEQDRCDLQDWAAAARMGEVKMRLGEFSLWDATSFIVTR